MTARKTRLRTRPPFAPVALVLAAVLVAAAGAKAHQLLAPPPGRTDLPPPYSGVLVCAELLLAAWLLSGIGAAACRLVTATCFALFAVVASAKAAAGRPSCGCFGGLAVTPWLMAAFDALAVLAISLAETRRGFGWPRVRLVAASFPLVGIALLAVSRPVFRQTAGGPGVAVSPSRLDLGEVGRGGSATGQFLVVNLSSTELAITEVEVSCPCLSVTLTARACGAGTTLAGGVRFDTTHEPDFVGDLAVVVTLRADGEPPLRFEVLVSVR